MRPHWLLPIFCTALSAGAQEPLSSAPLARFAPELFELPLHRAPRAEGEPEAALMATRGAYKASFGASFAFHPFLGSERPRNLPLEWRTRVLRHGGVEEQPVEKPIERLGEWRCERDHGNWSEIYEARREGVEQSFAIEKRLGDGDLVIEGALRTELRAPATGFAARALDFADEHGDVVARYGRATVFDAAGRSTDVETSYDGSSLALRVADAWLDAAQFPIVVDPLFTNTLVNATNFGVVGSMEIAMQNETVARRILIAYTRIFSATDHDVFAIVCDTGYANPIVAHSDLTTAASDKDVCVTYVHAADRWVIGYQREFSNASGDFSTIRLFFRDRDSAAAQLGLPVSLQGNNTTSFTLPDLGGSEGSNVTSPLGLLVCRQDATTSRQNTQHSEVLAFPIDAATRTVLAPQYASSYPIGANLDRDMPAVNSGRGFDGDGWAIIYKEQDNSVGGFGARLRVARTDPQGVTQEAQTLATDSLLSASTAPKIEGTSGYYVAVYGRTGWPSSAADRIFGAHFQYLWGASSISTVIRTLAEGPSVLEFVRNLSLAFDSRTSSHWAVAFTDRNAQGTRLGRVLRLGGTAGIVESQTLSVGGYDDAIQAVCCNLGERGFLLAHSTNETNDPIYGTRFDYPSEAQTTSFGTACGAGTISGSSPYAGNTSYVHVLGGAPATTPAFLLVSAASANLALDGLGMPGCVANVHVGAPLLFTLARVTNEFGYASFSIDLPDFPVFIGDYYAQGLYLDPFLNALGVGATRGAHVQVR